MGRLKKFAKGSHKREGDGAGHSSFFVPVKSSEQSAEGGADGKRRKRKQQQRHTKLPRFNVAQKNFKRELHKNDQKLDVQSEEEEKTLKRNDDEKATESAVTGAGDDREQTTSSGSGQKQRKGKGYLSAYKRAQLTYERLRSERQERAQKERVEREQQKAEQEFEMKWRKRKNQALMLRTHRGQPNLNAQIEVLLEKIQRETDAQK